MFPEVIISRPIHDPRERWARLLRENRLGRTVGLVFYTPKFWDCREHDFDSGWQKFERDISAGPPVWHVIFAAEQKAIHVNCTRRHMSYRGYAYWVGPKRRYYLYYMGADLGYGPKRSWWKILQVREHGEYVKWV